MKNIYIKNFFKSINGGEKILDYGCGYAPYKELAEEKYQKYLTAEFPATSELIYKNKSDYVIKKDETINCEDNFFDCVMITEVLEHVYKPLESLKEICRILKKNGFIMGTVPFQMNEHDPPYDYFRYTYYAVKKLLEDSNFRNIEITYVGDSIGSLLFLINRNFGIFLKILRKLKLGILAKLLNTLVFKIPDYIYYYLYIAGIRFNKINYFKICPLGFFFVAQK